MPLVLDGTNGVSGVDGTASNPAIEGTDSNTGIFYPAADTVAIGTGGTEALRVTSAQNVGIGTNSPGGKLAVDPGNNSGTRIDGLHLSKNLTLQANYVAWQQGTVGWRVGIDYNNMNYPLSFLYGSSTPTASSPGTEVARITSDANFQFNSGYGSVATAYGCRAWVNFNGTGTVAIRASGNVTSITDNSAGDYTVNFTTAMPDANYGVTLGGRNTSGGSTNGRTLLSSSTTALQTTSVRVVFVNVADTAFLDAETYCVSIFR